MTKYIYKGPVWKFNTLMRSYAQYVTFADSERKAINNIKFQAAKDLGYDMRKGVVIKLDLNKLYTVDDAKNLESDNDTKVCPKCGKVYLNDLGKCPVCDLGDTFVLDEAVTDLSLSTPYMLDNKGNLYTCGSYHPYISSVFNSIEEDTESLVSDRLNELEWFYKHISNNQILENIRVIINSADKFNLLIGDKNKFDVSEDTYVCKDLFELYDYVENINNETNQMFCRVRTSNVKYGGDSKDIYFRISSVGFNWFDIIWNVVNRYAHKITTVTICKDNKAKDFEQGKAYMINKKELDHMPVSEFLVLPDNMVIETLQTDDNFMKNSFIDLQNKKTLAETYLNMSIKDINTFYHKQKQLEEDFDINFILSKGTGKNNHLNESIESNTPYMLRNDGKMFNCKPAHPYIRIYNKVDFKTNLDELLNLNYNSIKWFFEHTLNMETKRITAVFIASLINNKDLINSLRHKENIWNNVNKLAEELSLPLDDIETDVEMVFNNLNDLTNQEFCRVRTSNIKAQYGGDNGEIYFRISSVEFNWFDLIWNIVVNNREFIKYVTIVKDEQTFGVAYDYYIIGGEKMKHIPVDDFITLNGNPVVESLESDRIEKITDFIEDLYDLRKTSIAQEGEYGLGNLVFKEMRALGYLDDLRELKNKLATKEMSLENLTEELKRRGPTDDELKHLEALFDYAGFEIVSKKRWDDEYHNQVHYQILSKFTVDNPDKFRAVVEWLDQTIGDWDELFHSPSTYSIGWQDDHHISAGIDCREIYYRDDTIPEKTSREKQREIDNK